MPYKLDTSIEGLARMIEPNIGHEQVTARLSGNYLVRWRQFKEVSMATSNSDVIKEALSLLFMCASTDEEGNLVEVIVRRKNVHGEQLPDIQLTERVHLPNLEAYRENRKKT